MTTPNIPFKPLGSPRQYRALKFLRERRCTVQFLLKHAGGNGIPQLISSLRYRCLHIKSVERVGTDRDGRKVKYCEYELQPESFELADLMLALEDDE